MTVVAEKGKANAAVIKLLARTWNLPRSSLRIVSGESSPRKQILIAGISARQAASLLQVAP